MHERHAAAQTAELGRLRENGSDDRSMQGTLNKVVVILRDWVSDLDRDVLPALRQGEEAVLKTYDQALADDDVASHPSVAALLRTQMADIHAEVARLPRD